MKKITIGFITLLILISIYFAYTIGSKRCNMIWKNGEW